MSALFFILFLICRKRMDSLDDDFPYEELDKFIFKEFINSLDSDMMTKKMLT